MPMDVRNPRNSSGRSTRDFRCRRSGEEEGGYLSSISKDGCDWTCSRYNFAIYSGQRAATINISILLCGFPTVGSGSENAFLMGNTYLSRRRVSRYTFIYGEKFRPIHFKTEEEDG